MYTHLYISRLNAERLFAAFADRSIPFEEYFASFHNIFLSGLAADLQNERSQDMFVLKFNRYLPHLPTKLVDMKIVPVRVKIVRMNSAPTKARAGYYEVPSQDLSATIERVFPAQHTTDGAPKLTAPLYAQNLWVSGPTLEAAQEFNSKLSMGFYARALVNAFE